MDSTAFLLLLYSKARHSSACHRSSRPPCAQLGELGGGRRGSSPRPALHLPASTLFPTITWLTGDDGCGEELAGGSLGSVLARWFCVALGGCFAVFFCFFAVFSELPSLYSPETRQPPDMSTMLRGLTWCAAGSGRGRGPTDLRGPAPPCLLPRAAAHRRVQCLAWAEELRATGRSPPGRL